MNLKNFYLKAICFSLLFLTLLNINCSFADYEEDEEETLSIINETITTSSNSTSPLELNARSCIVLDRLSKTIIYGKNEDNKVKMASTTKIMTATVIIENCDLNQTIEVSKKAAGTGGSRLGLKTGDKITIRDLLYGLMLCSGNDAAVALAETAGGSVAGFSEMMNNKAKELGLYNSHFESPHGLDSNGHYTTAYELALLTDYALKNETFANIVGTKNYTVTINGYPKSLNNTNELLGVLNGVYGVKTGFTNGANRCLVTACKRGDMDIICIVLGCDTKKFRTSDSVKLIEYAFKNFEYVNIGKLVDDKFEEWKAENHSQDKNYFDIYKASNSAKLEINYSALSQSVIPVLKSDIPSIKVDIEIAKSFEAPILPNNVIGGITVSSDSGFIDYCNVFTTNEVPKKSVYEYFVDLFCHWGRSFWAEIYQHANRLPFYKELKQIKEAL